MKIVAVIFKSLLIIVIGFVGYLYFSTLLPNTEEMRQYYSNRQDEFETENLKIIADLKAGQIINSKENKEIGYLYVQAILKPSISIKYYTHWRGFGVGAFGPRNAYLENPPYRIYSSLEDMDNDYKSTDGFVGFGTLSPNWYYFRWNTD